MPTARECQEEARRFGRPNQCHSRSCRFRYSKTEKNQTPETGGGGCNAGECPREKRPATVWALCF